MTKFYGEQKNYIGAKLEVEYGDDTDDNQENTN